MFPGTIKILNSVETAGGLRVFVTSSDVRLVYNENTFDYDFLSIGDPEDKPDPSFFQKAIKMVETARGDGLDLSKCVIVGDSFNSDIKTPIEEMGFGIGILFKKDQKEPIWESEILVTTGNLATLI